MAFPKQMTMLYREAKSQIIPRILAIQHGGGVGYDLDSTWWAIIIHIKQAQVPSTEGVWHDLFDRSQCLPKTGGFKPTWLASWHGLKKSKEESIEAGEKTYVRPRSSINCYRCFSQRWLYQLRRSVQKIMFQIASSALAACVLEQALKPSGSSGLGIALTMRNSYWPKGEI